MKALVDCDVGRKVPSFMISLGFKDVHVEVEADKIFTVIDAMGIHREHVVIPLGTGKGRVRRMPSGKLEIVVDAETPFDEWLDRLPDLIKAAQTA